MFLNHRDNYFNSIYLISILDITIQYNDSDDKAMSRAMVTNLTITQAVESKKLMYSQS